MSVDVATSTPPPVAREVRSRRARYVRGVELNGANVLVTGGASGIGAATVDALHDSGARVAVLDLAATSNGDVHHRVDVGDEVALVDAVAAASRDLAPLDGAVINAGIGGMAPLLRMTTAEWDRVMNVNLRGAFVTMRECGRAMVGASRPGSIVAVTSVSGFLTDRRMAHYSVSKAGLAALVRVAAREFGEHGIRVNAVAPGTTDTPMFAATDRLPGYRERVAQRAALGRLGTADDVAAAIVSLLQLDWVTGQVLVADGGVSLASPIDPLDSV
jgi:NAD(P)-dependent dehydrogenase (short-subunit alcohol dehydrogenase family)